MVLLRVLSPNFAINILYFNDPGARITIAYSLPPSRYVGDGNFILVATGSKLPSGGTLISFGLREILHHSSTNKLVGVPNSISLSSIKHFLSGSTVLKNRSNSVKNTPDPSGIVND